ncbi:MAG: InlB B-repeat-containing protein [Anaeroplasmataceae bacterium]|nr:InlB B-repeat-containing protein [Anaeroplasmataceae bacterium]
MKLKKIIIGLFMISAVIGLAACKTDDDPNQNIPPEEDVLKYTVTFDTDGGSAIAVQNVERGQTISNPDTPVKAGYEFKGWYKDKACNYIWDFEEDIVTGNVTLYAKWEAKVIYTVIFDSKEGSPVDSQQVKYNEKAQRPISPTREGYIFAGWFTESACIYEFDFVNTEITKDITLYAKWVERSTDPTKVKVLFNSKGGSLVPDLTDVEIGSKISKPADPVREGYTFVGWFKDEDGPLTGKFNFEEEVITEGITLFARWDINMYTITFDSNNGSSVESQSVGYKHKAQRPVSPTREGYIFAGWFTESSFIHEFDFVNTEITNSITLYAKWVERSTDPTKVKVLFNSKGGSLVPDLTDVEIGSKISKPTDPVREGYTFLGWFKDEDGPLTGKFNFEEEVITEGITLYARWEINIYTVTFNSNNGSSVESQKVQYDHVASRPVSPTREGYIFAGWFTEAAGIHEFDFVNTKITGNITLYAKWTPNSSTSDVFTVTFNSKDGSYVPAIENILPGSKIQRPTDPIREGYRFLGWFKDENGPLRDEFNFDEEVITENIILYARWEVSEYKVTFSGTTLAPQIVPVGGKITKPSPDPVKANHIFVGWYEDAAFTRIWDFDTVLTSSITLYAKFEEKLPTDQDNTIKFPFNSFHTTAQANLDSSTGKTNKDLTTGQFTVDAGVKTEAAILNTQGKGVTFTVNGTISNGFVLTGTGASTGKVVTVTLYQGTNILGTWEIGYQATKTITVDGLDAGSYKITTSGSVRITNFTLYEYNVPVELVVHFDSKNGTRVPDVVVNKWGKLTAPTAPTKDGYIFAGWYIDDSLQTAFDFNTKILEEMTLYAKWDEKPVDPNLTIYTISYNPHGGNDIPDKQVNEGNKVAAPENPVREGYTFVGWYEEDSYINLHDFTKPVNQNYTLHARWVEKPLVISFVGADIEDMQVYRNNTIEEPATPQRPNYIFEGWYEDEAFTKRFDFSIPLTKDTTIYVRWEKDPDASDYIEGGQGTVGQKGTVEITEAMGLSEAAYITFKKVTGATGYSITLKNSSNAIRVLDDNSVYIREVNGGMRADIFGVVPGTYEATILPLNTSSANPSTATFNVGAYDRSGYAHFNYTDGVGAYNDDGSLKKNAIVLYVTDANKNTVSITHKGITVTGIGNILNSVGEDVGGGVTAKGGKANTNQGILKLLAEDNIPLVVRFIGCVSNTGLYKQGTFAASTAPKVEGLTIYNSLDNGGSVGDNGHMARMKSGKNITLEGVGEDAIVDGWGFHFMAESSAPDLGKNFEVRNLTFINTPEDAVGMEGVQSTANTSAIITASVERCWVHNCEFYCPSISSPAESDKAQGDGSVDFKRGQYFTCSYNYYEGCHKTNLVGSADSSLQFNLTYHHNYYKNCESRGPLSRNANIHMYNNVFEGQSSYAMDARATAFIFSEYNLFYCCKSPQTNASGGVIKSYNDCFSSVINDQLGVIVTDKTQNVSNSCQYIAGGIDYSKFETNPNQSYIPSGDYVLQTNMTDVRKACAARCGVVKDHGVAMQDVPMSQISYLPSGVTPTKVTSYPTTLTPGKISKVVYAFTLDRTTEVTVSYTGEGVLVNEAGEKFIDGNGTAILKPGTYMCQSVNFNPDKGSGLSFKDLTINSIEIKEHNSEELNQQIIAEFEAKVAKIPAEIVYTDSCLASITSAREAYNQLSPELKTRVTASYTKIQNAYSEYLAKGVAYVESLISAIGVVNADSGTAISTARAEYTKLYNTDSSVRVSNLSTLTAAEAAFATYAIDSCIAKIEAIGTVTLESGDAINAALNEYNALSATDKEKITNRQKLFDAEKAYSDLVAVANVNTLIEEADLTNLDSCLAVKDAYNHLTAEQKAMVENTEKMSDIFVASVQLLIDALPATITLDDGDAIKAAEAAYQALTIDEKTRVSNYATLTAAREAYDALLSARTECTFDGAPSSPEVTVSGKYGATSATIAGITYAKGLKMESSTSASFTTTTAKTLTLHVTAGKKIKVDGTSYTVDSTGVLTVEIGAGTHTITKDTTSTLLYALFY